MLSLNVLNSCGCPAAWQVRLGTHATQEQVVTRPSNNSSNSNGKRIWKVHDSSAVLVGCSAKKPLLSVPSFELIVPFFFLLLLLLLWNVYKKPENRISSSSSSKAVPPPLTWDERVMHSLTIRQGKADSQPHLIEMRIDVCCLLEWSQ